MQAQKRFAKLVLPVAVALPSLAALAAQSAMAADGAGAEATAPGATAPVVAIARPSADATTTTVAGVQPAAAALSQAPTTAATVADAPVATSADAKAASAAKDAKDTSFGVAMSSDQLDEHRGGDALISNMNLTGSVEGNLASHVATGSNTVDGGSFANSSGLPTVIQNTGANVLIQNATILNVRFGD